MLKKLLTLIFINLYGLVISQGLIIDHTCLDIEGIPSNIIDSVKQNIRFQWCGQSHSHQVTSGFELLESDNSLYDVTIGKPYLPVSNAFNIMEGLSMFNQCGNCCWEYIYPQAYWQGQDAWDDIEFTFTECYPTINLSGFLWCSEPSEYDTNYFRAYMDALANYESTYPDIQFIYTTGHAQASGQDGYNRWKINEFIRNYCIENNKILYDFGDIDCWYNGEFNYYIYQGDTVPLQHPQYEEEVIYHTTPESCKNKARAMWYLMAKLSGWENRIDVNIKVYLEGSFNGSEMSTNLNSSGFLPLSQPYNGEPWNYEVTESVESIPTNKVVDWILVELRDANYVTDATNETIFGKRAGFLLNDGSVVDLDGFSPLSFYGSVNDSLFVVVRHQSHLDIISAKPALLSENVYVYDFTSSEFHVYGDENGHKQIAPNVWGMFSGDGNGDGEINIDDKNINWLNQTGLSGYRNADFDMRGKVDNQDKNEFWLINLGKTAQIPE